MLFGGNLPNFISLLRLPLAFLFIIDSVPSRVAILALALLTDGLDGWLARRFNQQSKLGAVLDPTTDKLFVLVALITLQIAKPLPLWQWAAFFSRDLALIAYGLFLISRSQLTRSPVQSIWPGKITTVLQFGTLALLTLGIAPPLFIWIAFIVLGVAFFSDLMARKLLA